MPWLYTSQGVSRASGLKHPIRYWFAIVRKPATTADRVQYRSIAAYRGRRLWCNYDASVCYARAFDRHEPMNKLKDIDGLFNGCHFDREVIILCVRWYLRYKLSFRDLAEMMAERDLSLVHTTIMRWVQHYTPEFVKRWNRFAAAAGQSWRVDGPM